MSDEYVKLIGLKVPHYFLLRLVYQSLLKGLYA